MLACLLLNRSSALARSWSVWCLWIRYTAEFNKDGIEQTTYLFTLAYVLIFVYLRILCFTFYFFTLLLFFSSCFVSCNAASSYLSCLGKPNTTVRPREEAAAADDEDEDEDEDGGNNKSCVAVVIRWSSSHGKW